MKAIWTLCVLAAIVLLCGAATAATYTSPAGTIRAGANYFSLPAVPTGNLDPNVVFAGMPITGKLAYWCRQTQEWHYYPTDFSQVMWHMAHRYDSDGDYTISFQGNQPAAEMSTCMNPIVAGFAFISQPYSWESSWADFTFSNDKLPGVRYTTAQAVAAGWIEDYAIEGAQDSGVRITLDGAGGTSTTFKPWQGYWVQSRIPAATGKLTIYWPTNPVPEPASLLAMASGLLALVGSALRRRS